MFTTSDYFIKKARETDFNDKKKTMAYIKEAILGMVAMEDELLRVIYDLRNQTAEFEAATNTVVQNFETEKKNAEIEINAVFGEDEGAVSENGTDVS